MRRHKSDLVILFTTLGLMAFGLIVIYVIGPMRANVLNSTYGTAYGENDFFFGQLRSCQSPASLSHSSLMALLVWYLLPLELALLRKFRAILVERGQNKMKILVVGGGSGGHITPVLAVIREILNEKPRAMVSFWTDRKYVRNVTKLTTELDVGNHIRVRRIPAGKFHRYARWGFKDYFIHLDIT